MINLNSRIDWQTGMEVTPQTFIALDQNMAHRQQVIGRISNGNLFGIIPASAFENRGVFVKNTLEIDRLVCMALLPDGQILHIDEVVVVPVPMLYGETYYLAGGFGEHPVGFDCQTIPFVRPDYTYGIYTLAQLEGSELFPLMKFRVNEGLFSIDPEYIPPYLLLSSCDRFAHYINLYIERLRQLAEHPHLEAGEGKRAFIRYVFQLKNYSLDNRVRNFIQFTQEIAQAIDYYVVSPNTEEPIVLERCSEYDVVTWLNWLNDYLHSASTLLDNVVPEDRSIDLEKLKAELRIELYNLLYPLLYDNLYEAIKRELHVEVREELLEQLSELINGRFREEMQALLWDELSDSLYDRLFDELYNRLYRELYTPLPEEKTDEFMPLI